MAEPTKRQRRIRRLGRFCLAAIALLLLAVLLYPFWLIRLLRPVASRLGVHIEQATRQGYERMRFDGIVWSNQTATVLIGALEIEAPHRLLVDWMMHAAASADPQLDLQHWVVEVHAGPASGSAGESSTSTALHQLQDALPSWQRWLRHARATDGEVRLGDRSIAVPRMVWRSGHLDVEAAQTALEVDLTKFADGAVTVAASNANVAVELALDEAREVWEVEGHLLWLSNRFEVRGGFGAEGALPASLLVESESFSLTPEVLGLSGFEPLRGHARVNWTNGVFTYDSAVTGASLDQGDWVPEQIAIRVRGQGDLETLTVTRFAVESPFINALLDEPLTVAYGGRVLGQRTRLRLQVDLGRIGAFPVAGLLNGHIDLEPVVYAPLRAGFRLAGDDLDGFGVHATRVEADGLLVWPLLQLTNVVVRLEPGVEGAAQLDLDLDTRRLENLRWTIEGPWPGAAQDGLLAESVRGNGAAEGVWPAIRHEGHLELVSPALAGFRADHIALDWAAEQSRATLLRLEARSGESVWRLAGSGSLSTAPDRVLAALRLDDAELASPAQALRLAEPVELEFMRSAETLSLGLSPLLLEGAGRQVGVNAHIHWPHQGYAGLELRELDPSLVQPFVQRPLPPLSMDHMDVTAGWTNGPLLFDLATRVRWRSPDGAAWALSAHVESDGDTIAVPATQLDLEGASVATLSGEWPVRFEPGLGREGLREASGTLSRLALHVRPGVRSLGWLERRTGMRIEQPTVDAAFTNDHGRVTGGLVARTRRVSLAQTNEAGGLVVPSVEDVFIAGDADLEAIRLSSATARSLGQPVSANGNYQVNAADWKGWWSLVWPPDWNRLSGRLDIRHAEIAALAKLAPDFVAPMGTLALELELAPNLQARGSLRVTNAATRPLEPLGALRDVQADITLVGWDATIRDLRATLLGRPIAVSGVVGGSPDGLRHMDLRVSGENLSLVHDPDMFIRADVNLQVQMPPEGVGRLAGEVNLRRSLLVRDFESFVSLDRAKPDQRPPWFSVGTEPFASLALDVRVNGDRFLSVITPAFKGEVSAGLQLFGTLREPFLVGAVTVDSGKLLFPFGQVALERGRVDFSREDPYRPYLEFRGEGQNFGFSITADLSGPMDSPNLTLQSVPPLTAQQILMMLSAGEIPRSDFGYSSSDKAGRIGYFVGKEFVNRFIGNTAATERLVLRSGEYITDDGGTSHMLEYKFTDRISIFGEYSRFQDFNSGLKVKVLSK